MGLLEPYDETKAGFEIFSKINIYVLVKYITNYSFYAGFPYDAVGTRKWNTC